MIITKVNSYSQETFLAVTPCTAGWNKTGGVCVVCCETKGFPWITPVGKILVPVPWFDREFVMTFHRQPKLTIREPLNYKDLYGNTTDLCKMVENNSVLSIKSTYPVSSCILCHLPAF